MGCFVIAGSPADVPGAAKEDGGMTTIREATMRILRKIAIRLVRLPRGRKLNM
jgi:hypothetical protein